MKMEQFQIYSASVTDRGLSEKRPENEDSLLEMPHKGIFAVADGVGGAQAGEVASQMAMEILGEAFSNQQPGRDPEDIMRDALEKANAAINRMSSELPQLSSMATTVAALHISGNIATIAHAGDSRVYRFDDSGNLFRETNDHSMVADEVRAGRMTEEQAENHPGKNIINRALGAEPYVDIELKTLMLSGNSRFLICSDGVTRHISDVEIAGLMSSSQTPLEICGAIRSTCYQRGAEDNLTAVVVYLVDSNESIPQDNALHDEEEMATVANARPAVYDLTAAENDLLEIDTGELDPGMIRGIGSSSPIPSQQQEAISQNLTGNISEHETLSPDTHSEHAHVSDRSAAYDHTYQNGLTPSDQKRNALLPALVGCILGLIAGLGIYHFFIAGRSSDTIPLTEMRSANIPLTAFEESRRTVDKDPAAYLKAETSPTDAESFYLTGRAHLLLGDFEKARTAFQSAKAKLPTSDPSNDLVIKNDISIALSVAESPAAQSFIQKQSQATNLARHLITSLTH